MKVGENEVKVGENLAAGEPATAVSPGRPLLAMPVWELVSPTGVLASGGGVAHRGRFLEGDVDAAAGGALDGLLGLVGEAVGPQAAAGTPHGGGVGHTGAGSPRDPPV